MKPRAHIYLDEALARQLDLLAERPGASKSAIVSAALKAYIERGGESGIDAALRNRLDKLSRELGRIDRDLQILIETLALYLRIYLTHTPLAAAKDLEAARAVGRERYASFIDQLGRHLASGAKRLPDMVERDDAEAAAATGPASPGIKSTPPSSVPPG